MWSSNATAQVLSITVASCNDEIEPINMNCQQRMHCVCCRNSANNYPRKVKCSYLIGINSSTNSFIYLLYNYGALEGTFVFKVRA